MTWLTRLAAGTLALVRRERGERELDEELRAFVESAIDDKMRRGMTRDQAARAVRIESGSIEAVKDAVRGVGWESALRALGQDVRFALRLLRRNRVFALTAAASLAIGIGAATAVFSIANGLLLQTAPGVTSPESLVDVVRAPVGPFGVNPVAYADYVEISRRTTLFESVYASQLDLEVVSVRTPDAAAAERAFGSFVSSSYFSALGVQVAAGRFFETDEERRATHAIVLSHRYWSRRFAAEPSVIGRSIQVNGHALIVGGVASDDFRGLSVVAPDFWMPLAAADQIKAGSGRLTNAGVNWLMLGGRLKPGVSAGQARAEIHAVGGAIESDDPRVDRPFEWRVARASPIPADMRVPVAGFLALLFGLVTLVLSIACANVAGLLVARAVARQREIAVRLAIGAGRGRLMRQLLTETLVLFLVAAVAGLAVARLITASLFTVLLSFPLPVAVSLPLDGRAIAFALSISLIAAILSGLIPAFLAARNAGVNGLRSGGYASADSLRLRNTFVVAQIALSILLVATAGLLVRALERAGSADRGFDPRGVEIATLDLTLGGLDATTGPAFVRDLLDRVRALPAVRAASVAFATPGRRTRRELRGTTTFSRAATAPGPNLGDADWSFVESGYFDTLRIPLLNGRDFNDADRSGAQPVVILTKRAAEFLWPAEPLQDVVGRYVPSGNDTADASSTNMLLVVGVAADVTDGRGETRVAVYTPWQQHYNPSVTLFLRTATGERAAGDIRALVATMNPNLPVLASQTLEEQLLAGPVTTQLRIASAVAGSVGLVGVLLAAIGIYGVTAYTVARRTREIGIRLAMGAGRGAIVTMVLRQGLWLTGTGAAIGLLLAAASTRLLKSLLFGVPPIDPIAFVGATALLAAVSLAACAAPVRRATAIEALEALRHE